MIPVEPRARLLLAAVAAAIGLATLVTLIVGVPGQLPGVALGSEVLLHVERVVAFTAALVVLLSVLAQAGGGRLPTQLSTSGLGYENDQAMQQQLANHQEQIDRLSALVADLMED